MLCSPFASLRMRLCCGGCK
uniref:Uncharacterized protein n=1 Tax=Arundo donax TaxID=35708 RepID=A0A0A8Y853_ARUDO